MDLILTEEVESFCKRLARKLTCEGDPDPRYKPQPRNMLSGLIDAYRKNVIGNGKHSALGEDTAAETKNFSWSFTAGADTAVDLQKIAVILRVPNPDPNDDAAQQRMFGRVVEHIVEHFRAPDRWNEAFSRVRAYVVHERFMKMADEIGFAMPQEDWERTAQEAGDSHPAQILKFLDEKLRKICGKGAERIRAMIDAQRDEPKKMREALARSEPKFVVLRIEKADKATLVQAIPDRFEPHLVLMLRPRPKARARQKK